MNGLVAANLSTRPQSPPAPNAAPDRPEPGKPGKQNDEVDAGELALDLTQMGLDIVGIFEPTPFADGANTLISLGRGDFGGAALSALGMIPYVGDAAKLGKMGKWAKTVANGVELALKNSDFAKAASPALKKIAEAIDAAPKSAFNALPNDVQQKLLEMRAAIGRVPGAAAEGAAGSISHKANAWSEYADGGGSWGYERWSKTYEGNMSRAKDANKAADNYMNKLDGNWAKREVTVQVEIDGQTYSRRLDIGPKDAALTQRGIEHKSGYQYLSKDNAWELERDAELVKLGWDMEWVIDGTASKPLQEALKAANIRFTTVD
ncbi:hypothetical protein [Paracoccus sp. (in: a-proteobacteria)]|uniref:hypothetical protein n=1 Tax=Paracoccus sp. TaxID=267 RepID=UPI003A86C39E